MVRREIARTWTHHDRANAQRFSRSDGSAKGHINRPDKTGPHQFSWYRLLVQVVGTGCWYRLLVQVIPADGHLSSIRTSSSAFEPGEGSNCSPPRTVSSAPQTSTALV